MEIPTPKDYEKLYKNGYSQGKGSPGKTFYQYYADYLIDPIIDLGCGAGDAVLYLRSKGLRADGVDWIRHNAKMMTRDITKPTEFWGYNTAICMDVLEHLEESGIRQVLTNMKSAKRQVMSVCTVPAVSGGALQLHLTIEPVKWWKKIISQYLEIVAEKPLKTHQHLFLCKKRDGNNKAS